MAELGTVCVGRRRDETRRRFYYVESDFGKDGTHPSRVGCDKIARELLRFFKTDSTARLWFTARR